MKLQILLPIISVLSMFACKSSSQMQDSKIADDFYLEIRHTGCRGNCPDYTIKVFSSGKVTWFGNRAVELMGNYEKKLTEKEMAALVSTLEEYKFSAFEVGYGLGVADLPSVITTCTRNGKTHKVENIRFGPDELKEMEQKLEGIIGTAGFVSTDKE